VSLGSQVVHVTKQHAMISSIILHAHKNRDTANNNLKLGAQ